MLKQVMNLTERFPAFIFCYLVGVFFTLPISSSAKSIFLVLATITILLYSPYRQMLISQLKQPWCILIGLFFLLAILGCLYSPAYAYEKAIVLEKYAKWLYLPILAVGFQEEKVRVSALHAFMLAMFLTCCLSFLAFFGFLSTEWINPDFVFRNHIMTGMMVSLSVFLSLWLFIHNGFECKKATARGWFVFYIAMFTLGTYQVLFISSGITGYVLYSLLMGLFLLWFLRKKTAILGVVFLLVIMSLAYITSPFMRIGVQRVWHDWHAFQEEKNTSIGYRLQFHKYARSLFEQSPWIGQGTASFTHLYAMDKPVPAWNRRLLEPHSQYYLIAVEWGVSGLVCFMALMIGLLYKVLQLSTFRLLGLATILMFSVGNLTDSLLFYSGSGYLFILLIALCLGEGYTSSSLRDVPIR